MSRREKGSRGENWGRRTTRDRFPTGFMPLFFIRRRRALRHQCPIFRRVPFLRRRAFISLYFLHARPRTSDINTIKCIVPKVLINSRPRCDTWNSAMRMYNFMKLCPLRNRFSSARIKKNSSLSCRCSQSQSPSLCTRPVLMRHCIPNRAHADEG